MRNNEIVEKVGAVLQAVPGVAAVVLGGSRARGTASAESDLKADVHPFPDALKTAIIGKFRWEVQFSIDNAALAVKRSEQTHVAGCAYRALCCIAQVLFALNGRYLINEKAALVEAATFPVTIAGLDAAVTDIWHGIGNRNFARALSSLSAWSADLNGLVARA